MEFLYLLGEFGDAALEIAGVMFELGVKGGALLGELGLDELFLCLDAG